MTQENPPPRQPLDEPSDVVDYAVVFRGALVGWVETPRQARRSDLRAAVAVPSPQEGGARRRDEAEQLRRKGAQRIPRRTASPDEIGVPPREIGEDVLQKTPEQLGVVTPESRDVGEQRGDTPRGQGVGQVRRGTPRELEEDSGPRGLGSRGCGRRGGALAPGGGILRLTGGGGRRRTSR